jgi:branched-chain amino acid transport system ATP-binding protein
MSDVILQTRGLTKEFKGFVAVNAVDLQVQRGHIHALIGPNGAGKTTCFNLLTKFLAPTGGTILYEGEDITGETSVRIARRGIVRSFQISAVFPHLTVLENVRIGLQRATGWSYRFWQSDRSLRVLDDQAMALLAQVGLEDFADAVTVELPYGRKRALEIATTLAMEPKLMLLDEPTQGMGHEDVERVTALIKKVSAGRTGADGRAQHERGVDDRRPHHRCSRAARCWPRAATPRSLAMRACSRRTWAPPRPSWKARTDAAAGRAPGAPRRAPTRHGRRPSSGRAPRPRRRGRASRATHKDTRRHMSATTTAAAPAAQDARARDAAAGDAALEIRGLHAWYGESHILHGVDLTVRRGEVVTLLGRNGAGRTTTLRAVMGLTGRREGSIKVGGTEAIRLPTHRVARLGIGYCPEERGIFSSLSAEENLMLPPPLGGSGGMSVDEIYAMFPNLKERARSQGTRLSGGEQQMLAVARILRTGATMLLLDEISEGLAP